MPDQGFGVGVGCRHVLLDGRNEFGDTQEAPAPDAFLSQLPEPSLDEIQPGGTSGGEVQLKPGMPGQPLLDLGLHMCPVVVHNEMEVQVLGEFPVQPSQEAQEFLVSVPRHAFPDHTSVQDVQSRKQGSSSMPLVVVGHGPTASLLHGQAGLGALEGLDLAFLVHTQDQGLVGRVEVQPHHIGEFLGEPPVLGEFESFRPVGLQPVSGPDALHGGLAQALSLGHGAGAPVGRPRGLSLDSGLHYLVHPFGSISDPPAPAGRDLGEGTRATLPEALAPEDDGGTTDMHLSGVPAIRQTISGKADDPGPEDDALGSVLGTDPGFQGSTLLGGYGQGIS